MRPRTDRHTSIQTRMTTIHFASSTTRAKYNDDDNNDFHVVCTEQFNKKSIYNKMHPDFDGGHKNWPAEHNSLNEKVCEQCVTPYIR